MVEAFITVFTFMRFVTGMYHFMFLLVTRMVEALSTVLTFMRFFSGMYRFVPLLVTNMVEALITVFTFMRFVTGVCHFMRPSCDQNSGSSYHNIDTYEVFHLYASFHVSSCDQLG